MNEETISRRGILAAPLVLAGCASASPYFGRTTPPSSQRLVYANGEEPSSLDPAQSMGGGGDNVIAALLDSLIALDPLTLEPAAALATHYEVDSSGTRYTLFFGDTRSLVEFASAIQILYPGILQRSKAPPDRIPALWSDGVPVTAHDFVYSWRRLVDPATAAPMAFYLAPLGMPMRSQKAQNLPVHWLSAPSMISRSNSNCGADIVFSKATLAAAVGRSSPTGDRSSPTAWTRGCLDSAGYVRVEWTLSVARMEGARSPRADKKPSVLGS